MLHFISLRINDVADVAGFLRLYNLELRNAGKEATVVLHAMGGEVDYGQCCDPKLIMRVVPSQSLFLIS